MGEGPGCSPDFRLKGFCPLEYKKLALLSEEYAREAFFGPGGMEFYFTASLMV